MQSFGEARCKVNGKWYPYTHPNCKSNTESTSDKSNTKSSSDFVMFKIQGGKFSPCVRITEVEGLAKARFREDIYWSHGTVAAALSPADSSGDNLRGFARS